MYQQIFFLSGGDTPMRKCTLIFVFFRISIFFSHACAVNEISIREDFHHYTEPGYIQKATLSVENYGAYCEQSLYIEYCDREQFPGNNVEIIHRFELPEHSVVHDLWLWIGDSVMQAEINDTRRAREIYDSVTSFKRDPAFLNVTNNQYELRIYPLQSGSFRKVKIRFIVPVRYIGMEAHVDLPLRFLKSDNSLQTPLQLLVRTDINSPHDISIMELPGMKFSPMSDTLGKSFQQMMFSDIKRHNSLTLMYQQMFNEGAAATTACDSSACYFTLGINPGDFFGITPPVEKPGKKIIGIDLSGIYGVPSDDLLSNLHNFLPSWLGESDTFKIFITAGNAFDTIPHAGWFYSKTDSIDIIISALDSSAALREIKITPVPGLLFCDDWAENDFAFPGLEKLAVCAKVNSIMDALPILQEYDIVVASMHGHEALLSDSEAESVHAALEQFWDKGGTFITYYDHNREKEKIASRYISGLQIPASFKASMLTRNADGIIGPNFPETFYYHTSCPLINSDSSVIEELLNEDNEPVVLSKRINNGLLVVTGMWPPHDDAGLKQQVHTALFGFQQLHQTRRLNDLLTALMQDNAAHPYDHALVLSNSDYLVTDQNLAEELIKIDTTGTGIGALPPVTSVNLLDGAHYTPPVFTLHNDNYYGSGYLLNYFSQETGGAYFGMHAYSWSFLSKVIDQATVSPVTITNYTIRVDGNSSTQNVIKELDRYNAGYNAACFYTGTTGPGDAITVSFTAQSMDSTHEKAVTFDIQECLPCTPDILDILSAIYAQEILTKMLNQTPIDTNAIVSFAMQHRILNDFTAFIALEPHDSVYFLDSPFDESNYPHVTDIQSDIAQQNRFDLTVTATLYETVARICVPLRGHIKLRIFNSAGQCVYSEMIAVENRGIHSVRIPKQALCKGAYICVAKFYAADTKGSSQRLISKFFIY
ncbi:MAG: hypothetical protein GF350_02870 [Chitinivibrionales bacterium]|nr:hypothetical protein [Chitinivibrionales bacterium]